MYGALFPRLNFIFFSIGFRSFFFSIGLLYVPMSNPHRANRNKPNYPNHIKNLLRKKNELFKLRHQSNGGIARYKAMSKRCRDEIRNFHLKKETEILETCDQNSVYRYIRSKLSSRPRVFELERNGVTYCTDEGIANQLNNQYCSVFSVDDGSIPDVPQKSNLVVDEFLITRRDVVLLTVLSQSRLVVRVG